MIKKLVLKNFRNHENLSLEFNNNFVYITGPNGSGKTSILESIHYISTTKSHRTNVDLEVIKNDNPFSMISLDTQDKRYSFVISEKGKIANINNKEIRRLSEFIGDLKVVMFSPEDLSLIKGSPSVRRNFIDLELMKLNKRYLLNLSTYKKILKQRNALLKNLDLKSDLTFLNILGNQLYEAGIKLIKIRQEFINSINIKTKLVYSKFSKHNIEIIYNPNLDKKSFLDYLTNNQKTDILYKTTTSGPHRDDFTIKFNGNLAKLASQGEIRLMVISIKLGLLKVIEEQSNSKVVLLLDDVLSELDEVIQEIFLNELPSDVQVIMNSAINIKNRNIQIIKLKEIEVWVNIIIMMHPIFKS